MSDSVTTEMFVRNIEIFANPFCTEYFLSRFFDPVKFARSISLMLYFQPLRVLRH